jgi:ketosteroid isomerase-like protein
MKKSLYLFICCLAFHAMANAQSKEEQAVTTAVETLRKAMVDADKNQLEALVADELSYGHSSGKVEDKAAFVEALTSGKSDFATIDLSEQTVKLVGNTAVVRHHLTGTLLDKGNTSAVNLGILMVWQKQKGRWQLLARQAFKL